MRLGLMAPGRPQVSTTVVGWSVYKDLNLGPLRPKRSALDRAELHTEIPDG